MVVDTLWFQAVSTVGFPIVAFFAMYYWATKSLKEIRQAVEDNTEVMKELIHYIRGGRR